MPKHAPPPKPPLAQTLVPTPDHAPSSSRPVRLVARDLDASGVFPSHSHPWGQVTYAVEGILRITAGNSTWIVPPLRAIWIPLNLAHEIVILQKARLRILYIDADVAPFQSGQCRVLEVSPLLRELIVALSDKDWAGPRETLVSALILDELSRSMTLPIRVSLPDDKRLKILCEMLISEPASQLTLEEWAKRVGASQRTLTRLFERELGATFSQWRQQVRLAHAAALISGGLPLSRVATALGYASQSAFSAMFKKKFGQSPIAFFAQKSNPS
jgi:AraC-like DNA-binding protein